MSDRPTTGYRIHTQALILGLLPAALMFIVLLLFFTHARLEAARSDQTSRSQLIADQLAPALEYDVLTGNQPGIRRLAQQVVSKPWVDSVVVYDLFGEQILEVHDELFSNPAPGSSTASFQADILQSSVTLLEDFGWDTGFLNQRKAPSRLGKVEVRVNESQLLSSQQEILTQSLTVAAIVFLLTYLLVKAMASRLARPVQHLTEQVEKLTLGQYEIHEAPSHVEEVRRLSESIQLLANTLSQHQSEQEQALLQLSRTQEKADEANRTRNRFLAMMNHELKTPLNGVVGMLAVLGDSALDAHQRHVLNSAQQSASRLGGLLDDLLDYSHLENRELKLRPEETRVAQLVEDVALYYRERALEKGLSISLDIAPEVQNRCWLIDPTRFRQMTRHLLDNAVKFTGSGNVVVSLSREDSGVSENPSALVLSVTDTGPGMTPSQRARLFKPFEAGETGYQRRHEGGGLGLALVNELTRMMGGRIEVNSEISRGTCIRLYLPAITEAVSAPSPDNPLEGKYALVVEDNPVNMTITVSTLKRLGLHCDQSFSGLDALSRWKRRRYDVVLMDCQMPLMDGFQTTREMRALQSGSTATPIIALTANTDAATEVECRSAGMDDFLSKPLRKDALEACLRRWLGPA